MWGWKTSEYRSETTGALRSKTKLQPNHTIMPAEAGCFAVENAFIQETNRIAPEIFHKAAAERPIVRLAGSNRGVFPNGMGLTIQNLTWERSFSTSTDDPWETVVNSDGGSANACLPPVTTLGFGQTARTMTPKHRAIETDYFCIRDILTDFQFVDALNSVKRNLAAVTAWEWARKYTADFYETAGHNLTLQRGTSGGITDNGSNGYSTTALPTGHLDMGVLENIYLEVQREGPSVQGVNMDTQEPVLEAIMSYEQYRLLILQNPTLLQNVQYAWMGAQNGAPMLPGGIPKKRKLFGNYVINIDPYPRRFAFSGGAYVEIPVWTSSSTTKGNKEDVNPAWKAAPYEEVIIWTPDVFQSLAWNASPSVPAPGWKFDPINSMGEWSIRNILERDCNPDGTMIFWRAIFGDVTKTINPSVGYSILVLRCNLPLNILSCYGS